MRTYQRGVTLIEVLVGISILAVTLIAIGFSVTSYVTARQELVSETKATYLTEEGYEVLRAIRDTDWNTLQALTPNATYYLALSTTTFATSNTPEIIDSTYRRSFIVRSVYRNATSDIVGSGAAGATLDNGTRQFDISVNGPTGTTTFYAILTNVHAI